ncbi:MAG: tail length tape measure protein [Rhodobacterales bacterium]|nr:MAG: tail length tape measure protein [Rhodobacterales bacterium]
MTCLFKHVARLTWFLLVVAGPGYASISDSQVCDHAAHVAHQQSGVPLAVLRAITRTETGRKSGDGFGPWPWTVNMEGKGVWFENRDAARAYVFRHFKRGARSFDVGCFQINYKWHHKQFSSIDEMFDPEANALYAARFLKQLHGELGDWTEAAGAYHSRTPKYANKYKAIYVKHKANLTGVLPANVPRRTRAARQRVQRENQFPLLQRGQTQPSLGSLVPREQTGGRPALLNLSSTFNG